MTSVRNGIEFEGIFDVVAEGLALRPESVAGFRIVVDGFDRLPLVVIAEHDELGLHAGVERVASLGGLLHGALQRHARAHVVRCVLVVEIGEDDGDFRIPRADKDRIEIGDRDLIGIGRPQLGKHRDRVHGELRPLADAQSLELRHRNRLRLGAAEDVDPAREDVFHARFFQVGLCLVDARLLGKCRRQRRRVNSSHERFLT